MHPRTDASYISFVLPHPLFRKMRTRDSHGHLNRFDSISRRVSRGPPNGFHQLVKHSGSHPQLRLIILEGTRLYIKQDRLWRIKRGAAAPDKYLSYLAYLGKSIYTIVINLNVVKSVSLANEKLANVNPLSIHSLFLQQSFPFPPRCARWLPIKIAGSKTMSPIGQRGSAGAGERREWSHLREQRILEGNRLHLSRVHVHTEGLD